ncbi:MULTISPECIES: aromatic amino acid lyase [Burkholderia]|uniref:Aromatic amino acid lyase n=1 Tax=Burkholderia sola TaxID=2843302 RepID=A0ABV2C925_9BURK|nr:MULTISPECIES: aromatic amino acid lyase [unclassified Burkholderia]MBP0607671.1 aromatic amino acid lyase [Burkholderia sp. CpTa8-5]MBP0717642.1 aromatic amino acid lyase [Burkholderia sp. AcTa6-5]
MNTRASFADNTIRIRGSALTTSDVAAAARRNDTRLEIDPGCLDMVRASRLTLEQLIAEGRVVYGVNTSMGGFVR